MSALNLGWCNTILANLRCALRTFDLLSLVDLANNVNASQLKATYAQAYLERGSRCPGIDFAGFLGRIKFMMDPDVLPVDGFRRAVAG